ncbi:polyprenyl synthetase family protein [Carboxylicivirga sediminis]|uniref:Polyprenyl synthetase family protein n=1 Tax=Carboxylicivirga sediminis TaxID=2006564 RepID=A0A941F824_9BACT|nr:polyprenyl synthetase family protein [Carboxylicivirga sediminis]MBR8537289.1 polyprenyl synthetase family protein [Carboxylicivirga sediminis]
MSDTKLIKSPIKEEMKEFEPYFKEQLKSKIPLLDVITNYVLRRKGKQMRPMLVFLSAKLNGEVSESSYIAATLIELLHTATLIHDDVVDETYQRRGFFSINALWKSKVAVLVGDFFLSKGLSLSLDTGQIDVLKVVSNAVSEMAEGELLQIEKSRKLDITEEVYYQIIRKKTATLIAACTKAGALSVGVNGDKLTNMAEFGENLGIAFQIRDDLFDYEQNGMIGKPTGNDIKEKKLTLPLIHALGKTDKQEQRRILRLIRRHHKNEKKVQEIIAFVKANGGIEYATEQMELFAEKAKNNLAGYPDSETKTALLTMVDYTLKRKK